MNDESPYTKVPNSIFDIEGLNIYERLVLLYIIRKTIGFNKKSDGISLSQFMKFMGISKPTVLKSIKKLKELKYIKVTKQTNSTGGKHFNRYTPLVNEIDKASKRDLQGVVNDVYIQKENNTKSEREDIFFNFYETLENKKILTKEFIDYLLISENVRNKIKYSSTIEKKLNNRNKETLINFDKWYLQDYTSRLNSKYSDYKYQDKKLYKVFNYYEMKSKSMFGLAFINDSNNTDRKYFNSIDEVEKFLKGLER